MTCDFEQSTAKWLANLIVYRQNGLFLDNSNPLRGKLCADEVFNLFSI